ncbi:hypothetical protein BFJ70_g12715 [Fusarium oxysporum]|uniref:Uncharacterized protein n=2 Tax=Fusarium oxysporum TaxID=5507 RepID=A0A420PK37_FUSOX|nr:hypothetical protein BFJ65_g8164 [Fusarium oxysporum f. sp. cepae]RKK92883.1 hypothetical protein BFJ71_g9876 [Fusarium oxysporum]RKK53946.1 hypothetical protein BFJ67_g4913 [Fusarium oxysporum f. sp. cepae]RKK57691.1 hypothetical protein BFJ66_g3033 [Fusarium oxysporum f. sp. cepae]RKL14975.1 hypothetical protein BFJ68_g6108 [Fusarium oxysporum]
MGGLDDLLVIPAVPERYVAQVNLMAAESVAVETCSANTEPTVIPSTISVL